MYGGALACRWLPLLGLVGGRRAHTSVGWPRHSFFLTTELNRTGGRSLLIRKDTTPHREGHATHYKQQATHAGFFLPRSNSQLHFSPDENKVFSLRGGTPLNCDYFYYHYYFYYYYHFNLPVTSSYGAHIIHLECRWRMDTLLPVGE